MSDLSYLVKTRGFCRTQITKLFGKVSSGVNLMSPIERHTCLAKAEKLESEISKLDKQILDKIWETEEEKQTDEDEEEDESKFDEELQGCESYSDKLCEIVATLKIIEEPSGAVTSSASANSVDSRTKLKLPEIPLPIYSRAKGESLKHFFSSFETIIDRYNLSNYEKYVYLKRQLDGEPLILINSLAAADQSYQNAKELLLSAFATEIVEKFDAVRRLSEIKLEYSDNPYEFVSEMRVVRDLFQNLNIDVDTVIQYFVWIGMNSGLQTQLVNVCNKNKPTIQEINDNIFIAIDRYNEVSGRIKAKREQSNVAKFKTLNKSPSLVAGYAADVKYPNSSGDAKVRVGQFCSLCSDPSTRVKTHTTRECPQYLTSEEKVRRLETLNACVKCGYLNHSTPECKFRFSRPCSICTKNHMSFLCVPPKHKTEHFSMEKANAGSHRSQPNHGKAVHSKSKPGDKVSSGVVWTAAAMQIRVGSEAILPTFTGLVRGVRIRAMKDSGCQPHFIVNSVAERLNLPVIARNIPLTVNGFNKSQKYLTNIVTVDLTIGSKSRVIQAVCVPEIKTELHLPALGKIVSGFISRGYKLADEALLKASDKITDIEFVLGTCDPDILVERQVPFGNPIPSVYSETAAGVLLYGDSRRILENLRYLPNTVDYCSEDGASINTGHGESVLSNISSQPVHEYSEVFKSDDYCEGLCSGTSFVVLDDHGKLNKKILDEATNDILESQCKNYLNYDNQDYPEDSTEVNDKLIKFVLDRVSRTEEGRLVMPLMWRSDVAHLLSGNLGLSTQILRSNLRKLEKNEVHFAMMDEVFREQESQGVIERIEDLSQFLKDNPNASFIPHMGVFKLDRATTKCRVVYLSNLSEKSSGSATLSHNQVMHPGPSLNQKITTAVLHLRFGEKLLCFDLKKAFLQIALPEVDSNRLLFLWFKGVPKKDFSIVAYRNLRLSFGLRCSPAILMLAMFKILCIDSEQDCPEMREFKKRLYSLFYMDNGGYSGSTEQVRWAYDNLPSVFEPYKFEIQQMVTNEPSIQNLIDANADETTPDCVKLLGLSWNRLNDTLSVNPINLDAEANTKRLILKSIASQYDVFGFQAPCLNRARLFLHVLQCDQALGWDRVLGDSLIKEWRLIAKQANATPVIEFRRFVGSQSDRYRLIAFCDASKAIYAAVVYIQNIKTNEVSFVMAKNRLVNKQLELKSIPTLELQALTLGVQTLFEVREELSGPKVVFPVIVEELNVFTDSMISLHWLNSYNHKLDKTQSRRSVFVMNRLDSILRQCQIFPVTFKFVSTHDNPADCMTRVVGYRRLIKTSFINGPLFLRSVDVPVGADFSSFEVLVPNPLSLIDLGSDTLEVSDFVATADSTNCTPEHLIPLNKFQSFRKTVRVQVRVVQFIEKLKAKVKEHNRGSLKNLECVPSETNLFDLISKNILLKDQMIHYGEIFTFLKSKSGRLKCIPPLVNQLNLFIDNDGLLKVKSKFGRWKENVNFCCPILLSKDSQLTKLLIRETHILMAHTGCYGLLTHLRKMYWIGKFFSTVKKVLRECIICRRLNARPVKLNQSPYREFRSSPPCEPYKFVFLDYIGPFTVKQNSKVKVWLLCVTCLWSRSVNIKLCPDLTVRSFLRAFQIHIFEQGIPSRVFSDLGSQLTAGANVILDFLKDVDTQVHLNENGIKSVTFDHYFKGNSSLGSLVEVCVKFVKRLMFGAVRNNVLNLNDFELLIAQTIHIVNKRPIAFKEGLRENEMVDVPSPITPELLTKGRDLVSLNVIPALKSSSDDHSDWSPNFGSAQMLREEFSKLKRVREELIKLYNEEFVKNLIHQAVDDKSRYKPVHHVKLKVGDLVLLKDPHLKAANFPMGIVRKVFSNVLGEVTDVIVQKGSTREQVRRHVSSIVPLLSCDEDNLPVVRKAAASQANAARSYSKRRAAKLGGVRTKEMLDDGLA